MDIHNFKRNFERIVNRIKESEDISKENKEIILNFKNYLLSENIGTAKIERYLSDLMKYSRMLDKSFEKASKEDIRRVIGEINQTNLAEETKKGFKIMLRKLYRFIEGIDDMVFLIGVHQLYGYSAEEILFEIKVSNLEF